MPAEGPEQVLRQALEESNKSRARLYLAIFRALERRLGRAAAVDVLQEAIHAWGRTLSGGLQACAPNDWDCLVDGFVVQPDGGAMFQPLVEKRDEASLVVHFQACPLKSAWVEAGLEPSEIAQLCAIAAQADYGTLEAAGFDVDIETWQPGAEGCCRLMIRARPA
jgi:hypothetical protein